MNIKINEPLMKYRDPISKITVDLGHADLFGTTQLEHKLWVDYIFDRFGATLERRFRRYVVAIVFATIIWGLGFIISLTIGFSNKYLSTSAVYYFWIGIAWCTNALRWLSQVYHIRTNAVRPCFVISDAVYKSIVSPFARKAVRNKRLFLRSTLISIPVLSYFGSIMSGYIKPLSFLALGFPSSFPIYWLSGNFLLAKLTIIAIFLWVAFLEVYTGAQLTLSTAPLYTKLAALPVGQYFFLKDYWHPPLILPIQVDGLVFGGLADLLFAFAMGGIATAAFPVLFRQITLAGNSKPRHWIGFAFMAIEGVCVIGLTQFLNVNSIFSSSAGLILTAALMILVRRDLFKSLVVSGLISGLALASAEGFLSFIVPLYLSRYWYLYHTEYGMLIFNRVPATELLWGIAFGMAIGPILDFYKGQTFAAKTETNFDSAIKLKYSDKPKKERLHT